MLYRTFILSLLLLFAVTAAFAGSKAYAEDGADSYSGFGEELFANQGHPALSGPATVADVLSGLEPAAGGEFDENAISHETNSGDKMFSPDITETGAENSDEPVAGSFGP